MSMPTSTCGSRTSRETAVRVVGAVHSLHDLPDGVLASSGERMTTAILDTLLALLQDGRRFTIVDAATYSGHDITQVSAVIAALGSVAHTLPEFAPYAAFFAPEPAEESNTNIAPPQPAPPTFDVQGAPSPDQENSHVPFGAHERTAGMPEHASENASARTVPETDSPRQALSPGGCGFRCGVVASGIAALLAYALVRTLKPS